MSKMIERVALAIAGAWNGQTSWDDLSEEYKGAAMQLARAAIEAMREPTEEMLDVVGDEWSPDFVWKSMICEVLGEKPKWWRVSSDVDRMDWKPIISMFDRMFGSTKG